MRYEYQPLCRKGAAITSGKIIDEANNIQLEGSLSSTGRYTSDGKCIFVIIDKSFNDVMMIFHFKVWQVELSYVN